MGAAPAAVAGVETAGAATATAATAAEGMTIGVETDTGAAEEVTAAVVEALRDGEGTATATAPLDDAASVEDEETAEEKLKCKLGEEEADEGRGWRGAVCSARWSLSSLLLSPSAAASATACALTAAAAADDTTRFGRTDAAWMLTRAAAPARGVRTEASRPGAAGAAVVVAAIGVVGESATDEASLPPRVAPITALVDALAVPLASSWLLLSMARVDEPRKERAVARSEAAE